MVISHCYVSSPEGKSHFYCWSNLMVCCKNSLQASKIGPWNPNVFSGEARDNFSEKPNDLVSKSWWCVVFYNLFDRLSFHEWFRLVKICKDQSSFYVFPNQIYIYIYVYIFHYHNNYYCPLNILVSPWFTTIKLTITNHNHSYHHHNWT